MRHVHVLHVAHVDVSHQQGQLPKALVQLAIAVRQVLDQT